MEQESVLERVRKLRAVAERTTNQNEAETALLLAQRLMVEHDLDERSIETADHGDVGVSDLDGDACAHRAAAWRNALACVVAENFRCVYYIGWGKGQASSLRIIRFVGRTADVRLAVEVYRQALLAATRLAGLHVAARKRPRVKRSTLLLWRKSFLFGFSAGLGQRFAQQREEHPEWGVVLVRDPEVDKALDVLLEGGTRWFSRASAAIEQGAWGAGFRAGAAFDPQTGRRLGEPS